ncbi:sce7726 family protein [Hydromonas duriensis]|uniref:SAP domain-containing protein n=1 Tax=Hydromonas duriensis TaxID=1527608 RepID=A0A4R6Y9J3_9BURK|nr:sce7726 family protein [Hydromonas duriensis]TDR32155.1 hypothetical protein DFR44_10538 [Hydromonas duriensis]
MTKKTMNENEIREILISFLSKKYSDEADVAFIKELFIEQFKQRADLVLANGKLVTYEIKSELDSLNRLPAQLESYTKHFEETIVVCAEKHVEKVKEIIGLEVGLWAVNIKGEFKAIQKPKKIKITKLSWLSHLPVDELRVLLKQYSFTRSGNRDTLTQTIVQKLSCNQVREYVLDYFKRREQKISLLKTRRLETKSLNNEYKRLNIDNSKTISVHSMETNTGSYTVLPRKTSNNPNPVPLHIHLNQELDLATVQ